MSKLSFQNDNDISKNFNGLEISFLKTGTQNKKQKVEKKYNHYNTLPDDVKINVEKYLDPEYFQPNLEDLQHNISECKTNAEFKAVVDIYVIIIPFKSSLTIDNNNITQIPHNLFLKIKNLKTLEIWNCGCLKSLPKEIGNLHNLEDLIVHGCDALTSLPKEIENLRNLKELHIQSCNSLESLPKEIGNLHVLFILEISACHSLTSLPKEIGNLHDLYKLLIRDCDSLTSIPEKIKDLKNYEVDITTEPRTLLDN